MSYTITNTHLVRKRTWIIPQNGLFKLNISKPFSFPVQFYGQLLLALAVFVSALSWIYLKSMHREKIHLLQSTQQKTEYLEQRSYQLYAQNNTELTSDYIRMVAKKNNLVLPDMKNTLLLPYQL